MAWRLFQLSNKKYFWTSLWMIIGTALGICFVLIHSYHEKLNSGMLLLWSFAYLMVGALVGFIFSVPKIISDSGIPASSISKNKIEENTNLTQISDWLTKILIGAGLVQLKEIPIFIGRVSRYMAMGIRQQNLPIYTNDSATIISTGIIIFFLTFGFIGGYLIMRLVLIEQFQDNK